MISRSSIVLLATLVAITPACRLMRDGVDAHDMTALMRAARDGDLAAASRLVADGARVNQAVRDHSTVRQLLGFLAWMQQLPTRDAGYRALHYASAGGHREMVRLLIGAGADVNAAAGAGATALSLAVGRSDEALARALLAAGAGARRPGDLPERAAWASPVVAAVSARNEVLLDLLLDAGADPDPAGTIPPLAMAASFGQTALVRLLLDHGAAPDRAAGEDQTPLILAARAGHVEAVRLLLDAGANPTRRDARARWTAGEWAASGRHNEVVALFERRAPGTVRAEDTELVRAVQERNGERVRQLLAAGARPGTRTAVGEPVLVVAVTGGQVDVARALLEAGADVRTPARGDPPYLSEAAVRGNLAMVRLLLEFGASAHPPGMATRAASGGNLEVLHALHAAGADVREHHDEPLRAAAMAGRPELVRYLVEAGADPNAADQHGRTALARAVAFRRHDAVRALLAAGANARVQDPESGWTPLMHAAMAGDSLMITLLRDAGADPTVRDGEGRTAADYARGAGQQRVLPLLRP